MKQNLMTKMQLEAQERYRQYQREEDEKKKIDYEKKKQQLDFLKDQMETDLKVELESINMEFFKIIILIYSEKR
jgi:hypothetical protein